MRIRPLILCGGSGTRLWPLSRKNYPKQFISLITKNTLFQDTLLRVNDSTFFFSPIIVCNKDYRFIVDEQINKININNNSILLEPVAKNTLPPIVAASFLIAQENPDDYILVLPSDHFIKDISTFKEIIINSLDVASKNKIVTFGILPSRPETGYGYIKYEKGTSNYYNVEKFIEKPDLEKAKEFLSAGNYLWNSGIYLFKSDLFLDEVLKYQPDIYYNSKESVKNIQKDLNFFILEATSFSKNQSIAIDYGISEKTDKMVVVPMNVGWNDIGTWTSIYNHLDKDINNNLIKGEVVALNTKNCYINAENKLIATSDIQDLVIINSNDSILIANKNNPDSIKEIVNNLNEQQRTEVSNKNLIHKPWGFINVLNDYQFYKIQKININPHGRLSLHYHNYRTEHWVVISGTGEVTINETIKTISKNESLFIPNKCIHSIYNNSNEPLIIIEIQTGEILSEEDIYRIKDFYHRS